MKNVLKKIMVVILSITMFVGQLPIVPINADTYHWYDYINQMLKRDYVEGEVIVAIDNTKKSFSLKKSFGGKDLSDQGEEIIEVNSDSIDVPTGGNNISIEVIERHDLTTKEILNKLKSDPSVVYAEPNYKTKISNTPSSIGGGVSGDTADMTGDQWGFDPSEQYSMKIPNWNNASGNMEHEVVVAVVDSGIDNEHEDLRNRVYALSAELQEKTGCDEKRCDIIGGEMNDHGTHVAGIIGAEWNNIGVSGVGSNIKMLDIRVADEDGAVDLSDVLTGYSKIKIAMENGVPVKAVNNSWGGYNTTLIFKAVMNELSSLGAVSVIAAGNEGRNLDNYLYNPIYSGLYDDSMIVVGASDIEGKRADFSNYSNSIVDLYAPGTDILSTIISNSEFDLSTISSIYLEDYEDTHNTTVIYDDNNLTTTMDSTYKSHGSKSLKIDLSDDMYEYDSNKGFYKSPLEVDFGDVNTETNPISGEKVLSIDVYSDDLIGISNENYYYNIYVKDKDGRIITLPSLNFQSAGDGWVRFFYSLPSTTDYDSFEIFFYYLSGTINDSFYIDNVNIYNADKSSYGYKQGTSMATPAVTGALAMLLGNVDEDLSAIEAKELLMSYVKPVSTLTGSKTNGILDLTTTNEVELSPTVSNITYNDKKITIKGNHFKDSEGIVVINNLDYYNDLSSATPSSISWSDNEIVLSFDEELVGVYEVKVTVGTKTNGGFVVTGESDKSFENHLSIHDDFSGKARMNRGFVLDGYLEAYKNYIYCMPDETEELKELYRYDIDNDVWKALSPMPKTLRTSQGAIYDGKIIMVATDTKHNNKMYAYAYDIATDTWEELNASNIPAKASTVVYKDKLKLIAGTKIYDYDYKNGTITEDMTLPTSILYPHAYTNNDVLYIINPVDGTMVRVKDDNAEAMTDVYANVPGTKSYLAYTMVKDGLMMVGDPNDSAHTNVYILKNGEDAFTPYEKRVSDDQLNESAMTSYNNKVYVMSRSLHDKNKTIFRSTSIETNDLNEDDIIYIITEGEDQTYTGNDLTIISNGDVDKLKRVLVNGEELDPSNYDVSDSTTVTLKSSYLNSLKPGKYDLTIQYGDGSVSTTFTITDKTNPKTYDGIYMYYYMFVISLLGLVFVRRISVK